MSTKKVTRGKRYSDNEKNEIVKFVLAYDAEKGRGGKSAASKKFGVTPITLTSWLKNASPISRGRGRPKASGANGAVKSISTGGSLAKLRELSSLAAKIQKAETELRKLKDRFDSIKVTL